MSANSARAECSTYAEEYPSKFEEIDIHQSAIEFVNTAFNARPRSTSAELAEPELNYDENSRDNPEIEINGDECLEDAFLQAPSSASSDGEIDLCSRSKCSSRPGTDCSWRTGEFPGSCNSDALGDQEFQEQEPAFFDSRRSSVAATEPRNILTLRSDSRNANLAMTPEELRIQTPPPAPTPTRRTRQRTFSASSSLGAKKTDSVQPLLTNYNKTIYTAGRPPWYDSAGHHIRPCVIGICGGSASGKTTVADNIIKALNIQWVTRLSMDCFYKVLNEKQHELSLHNEYNFDHPDAFDFPLLLKTLKRLCDGKKVEVPVYNFVTHSRDAKTKTMYGANVIIFEGILAFHHPEVNKLLDVKVFVDTDADDRLARRLRRDITERGRDLNGVIKQYTFFVKPAFDCYIAPLMAHADIIVPRGGNNEVAIDLIVQHVQRELLARGLKIREKLVEDWPRGNTKNPDSLFTLPATPQVIGLHTYIRSADTPRDEFIFYSKRLIRLVVEYALSLMPFEDTLVETPQGFRYQGKRCSVNKLCGVSILRAGETMEQALNDVCKDIRIGKVLIQTNPSTGEPELYYCRLPKDIADYHIMLMDASVGSGAAAMMGIRILLDHDVPEENIILLSLLMARTGVHSIAYAFPKVKLVTTAVDPELNEKFYVMPGMGNFGDRYFGTEPCQELVQMHKSNTVNGL